MEDRSANIVDHVVAVTTIVATTTHIMHLFSKYMPLFASTCAVIWYTLRVISWAKSIINKDKKNADDA